MIPEAAVEALARILASEALHRADTNGYGMDSDADSINLFLPLARKRAVRYLEAAAPHIKAQALEDAAKEIIAPGASSVASAWLNTRANMLRPTP